MKILFRFTLLFMVFLSSAAALNKNNVPEPLKPWVDWVLYDEKQKQCLSVYNNDKIHYCTWPSYLDVTVYKNEIAFKQEWQVMKKNMDTFAR